MPKDRDQLTPDEPDDLDRVAPEATRAVDDDPAPEDAPGAPPLGGAAGS